MEAIISRRSSRVNYVESSDDDEDNLSTSIAQDVVQEVIDSFSEPSGLELNRKKQYKKIYKTA